MFEQKINEFAVKTKPNYITITVIRFMSSMPLGTSDVISVQSCVYPANWEDLLLGHGGALEEQGLGGEGCVCPSLQDAEHGHQFIMSQRCNERWLPAKDAPFHIG